MAALATTPISSIPLYAPIDSPAPTPATSRSKFPIDVNLNSKLSIVNLPAYTIEADALLIATNESFSERGGVVGKVWEICGKDLEREVGKAEKVSFS
jgi:hypothetical protein